MRSASVLLLLLTAFRGEAATRSDEEAVIAATLATYFNIMHGGTGVAFPEQRRPLLLHRMTIAPPRSRLNVRVSSPANAQPARDYRSPAVATLVADLLKRSARPIEVATPSQYSRSKARIGECGPEADPARFADAVAVSRPGFRSREAAIVYLEHQGGGSAYYLRRVHNTWKVEWDVELWACG